MRPGLVIDGRYTLLRELGAGGMATVWEAEHRTLRHRVAIKFIGDPDPAVGHHRERFEQEAQALAAVRHPHVVQVLDFGTTDDGAYYMAMELLEAGSLADRIEAESPMAVAPAVRIATQVLGALAAVHGAGLVHRDLKPENVLFAQDDEGVRVPKLVDFGISKHLDDDGTGERPVTREGIVLGTPEYMAPEQARGQPIDHRADLYAVGAMLYEMLSGVRPYDAETTASLLLKVIAGKAQPVGEVHASVPGEVSAVVERAMANDPAERHADAREMREALFAAAPGALARDLGTTSALDAADSGMGAAPASAQSSAPVRRRRGIGPWLLGAAVAAAAALGALYALPGRSELAGPGRETPSPPPPVALEADGAAVTGDRIAIRLSGVPEGAHVYLDSHPVDEDGARQPDGSLVLTLDKRSGPFDLRVTKPGFEDWHVRRWGLRSFSFEVSLRARPRKAR